MAEIISFDQNPLLKFKKELENKDKIIEQLNAELSVTKQKLGSLISVNEMLKLQLADLANNLSLYQHQLGGMIVNLNNLKNKLPTIDSRMHGTKTQDRPKKKPAEVKELNPESSENSDNGETNDDSDDE